MAILNANSFYMNYVDFWGRPDPDMLEIGTNWATGGSEALTDTQQRTHFALWAAMKSPLLFGAYFNNITDYSASVLKNSYLLAFNQDDAYGKPAMPYKWGTNPDWTFDNAHPAEYWSGQSKAGTLILALNSSPGSQTKHINFGEIPGLQAGASYQLTDIWQDKSIGCMTGQFDVVVGAYDTAGYLVTGTCSGKRDGFIAKDFSA
jgi:alpha-galactosidase